MFESNRIVIMYFDTPYKIVIEAGGLYTQKLALKLYSIQNRE